MPPVETTAFLERLFAMTEPRLDTLQESYSAESIGGLDAEEIASLKEFLGRVENYLDSTLEGLNSLRRVVAEDDVAAVSRCANSLTEDSERVHATDMGALAAALAGRAGEARSTLGFDDDVDRLWREFDKLAAAATTVKNSLKVLATTPHLSGP